jgi:hypothetical protein
MPVLARSDGTVADGHLRLKTARKLGHSSNPNARWDHHRRRTQNATGYRMVIGSNAEPWLVVCTANTGSRRRLRDSWTIFSRATGAGSRLRSPEILYENRGEVMTEVRVRVSQPAVERTAPDHGI